MNVFSVFTMENSEFFIATEEIVECEQFFSLSCRLPFSECLLRNVFAGFTCLDMNLKILLFHQTQFLNIP